MWLAIYSFFLLQSLCKASHFRGATIQWSPIYRGEVNETLFTGIIQITHQISWTRDSTEGGNCDSNVIQFGRLLGGDTGTLTCRAGCVGDIGTMDYFCTDFSVQNNWSTGKRSYEYNSSGVEQFRASFRSGAWAVLVFGGGGWELQVRFNLTERQDTGRVNTSPSTVFFPNLQRQHGCNHTIQIPVFDADRDVVRCRWAVGRECAGVCFAFPGVLNSDTCTIQYEATGPLGLYAVAIQVEDYATATSKQPLSSVPVQFLVEMVDLGISCDAQVEFVANTPVNGACIGVPLGQTYSGQITASAAEGNRIEEIQTISPPGLQRTALTMGDNPQQWYIGFEWTAVPSLSGPNLFCFSAHDNIGVSSSQECITLLGGAKAPEIVADSTNPTGLINQTDFLEWQVEFDTPVARPSTSKFIRVFSEDDLEVLSIDVSVSDSVFYPESSSGQELRFQTNYSFEEGRTYYIMFESGVAVNVDRGCATNSLPIDDQNQWTVSVIVRDPCLEEPCDSNADCTQLDLLTSNFSCTCNSGFTGDGFSCTVPDPCLSSPCDTNADCFRDSLINALFNCSCRAPFEGTGINCSIPDPCLSEPCDIDASCEREGLLSDSFTCSCEEPFTGDGFNCSVQDPCLSDPCDENAICRRVGLKSMEFTCGCSLNYTGDGFNCVIIQEMQPESTSPGVIAASVVTVIGLLSLVILIGATYGYVKVLLTIRKSQNDTLL